MQLFPSASSSVRRAHWYVVLVLSALHLLLVGSQVQSAAPPNPPAEAVEEVPGPPLFDPEERHTNPWFMSLAVVGASTTPGLGPIATTGTLYAGERYRSWSLEGPLSYWHPRVALTASTLVGLGSTIAGLPGVADLATLQIGEYLDCWILQDTDRFRPLPTSWLREIEDGKGIAEGGFEADIYARTLARVQYTSPAALAKALSRGVTYTHVFQEPERYRGSVIRVEGRLLRVNRYDPPFEARQAGVHHLYEGWVFSEFLGANPYVVIFTNWPANLPESLLGQPKIREDIRVSMDGFFFKKFRYQSNDRRSSHRDAPLVIGNTLTVLSLPEPTAERPTTWVHTLLYGFVSGFVLLVVCVLGLTYWYRRSDNRLRQRLLSRLPEFHLPPPDAMPVAPPIAPMARPTAPSSSNRPILPRRPRIIFPPGSGERGKPPSGESESRDPPPDEGSGA